MRLHDELRYSFGERGKLISKKFLMIKTTYIWPNDVDGQIGSPRDVGKP